MSKVIETRNVNLAIKSKAGGDTFIPVATPCEVYDSVLCIHLDVCDYGQGPQGPKWTISHVRTGLGIFGGISKQQAERCIRHLLIRGADLWQWGEFSISSTDPSSKAYEAYKLRNEARDMDFTKPAKVNTSRMAGLFKTGA